MIHSSELCWLLYCAKCNLITFFMIKQWMEIKSSKNCSQFLIVIPSFNVKKMSIFQFSAFLIALFCFGELENIRKTFQFNFLVLFLVPSLLPVNSETPAKKEDSLHQVWLLNFFSNSVKKKKKLFIGFHSRKGQSKRKTFLFCEISVVCLESSKMKNIQQICRRLNMEMGTFAPAFW